MGSSTPSAPTHAARSSSCFLDRGPRRCGRIRLREDTLDPQHVRGPVMDRVEPADDPVAVEDRHDEIPVLTLRLRDVDLEAEPEPEQLLGARPIVDQTVERREQHGPPAERAIEDLGVRPPLPREPVDGDANGPPLSLECGQGAFPPGGSSPFEGPPEAGDLGDPRARSWISRRRRASSPALGRAASDGRLLDARSHTRSCPARPAIMTSPFAHRTSSIIEVLRPSSFHPPVCHPSADRSSKARVASGPSLPGS